MIVNLKNYEHLKPCFHYFLENNKDGEKLELSTRYAVGSHCPIIVIYYFLYEVTQDNEVLLRIENLKKFYKYTKIIGEERYLNKE